jgi:hypothetical protein
MILNTLTAILLFMDAVCLVLAVFLAVSSARQLRSSSFAQGQERLESIEQGTTLTLLVALIIVGLRAVSWPLLYATLESYVSSIEGAMCVYGVTQMSPRLSAAVQIAQPIVFFLAGGWLLVNRVDRMTKTSPLAGKKTIYLFGLALVLLFVIPLEILLVAGIRPTFVVTCCTTVADVENRPAAAIPRQLVGEQYTGPLQAAFFGLSLLLIVLAALGGFLRPAERRGPRRAFFFGAGSLLALFVFGAAWPFSVEVLAPRWMDLPYHHCLYCFIVYRDAPLAVGAFLLGIFAIGWAGLLQVLAGGDEAHPFSSALGRRLHAWAFFLLLGSVGMAAVHLWLGEAWVR